MIDKDVRIIKRGFYGNTRTPTTHPLLDLFPADGEWTETEYYFVSERGKFVELSNGKLEFPPMPTEFHQLIAARLFAVLFAFVAQYKLGQVRFALSPFNFGKAKCASRTSSSCLTSTQIESRNIGACLIWLSRSFLRTMSVGIELSKK